MTSVLNTRLPARIIFDATNPEHRLAASRIINIAVTKDDPRFHVEPGYTNVRYMVVAKMVQYYLENDDQVRQLEIQQSELTPV